MITFPIYGFKKKVPNHQPEYVTSLLIFLNVTQL